MDAPRYGGRFADALGWAAELHAGQVRKGTAVPYVAHLLAVCALVWEDGGDEDEAVAALLHDAVEDVGEPGLLARIEERCGARPAGIVAACTDAWQRPKPPWRQRKEAHLASLRDVDDLGALRVFAADKVHNAEAIAADLAAHGPQVWERFNAGPEEVVWYHAAGHRLVAERLGEDSGLPGRLGAAVERLRRAPRPETTEG